MQYKRVMALTLLSAAFYYAGDELRSLYGLDPPYALFFTGYALVLISYLFALIAIILVIVNICRSLIRRRA